MLTDKTSRAHIEARNRIVDATFADAYSAHRYGGEEWSNAAALLLGRGYDEKTTTAILLSTHMRHAADMYGNDDNTADGSVIGNFINANPAYFTAAALGRLVD